MEFKRKSEQWEAALRIKLTQLQDLKRNISTDQNIPSEIKKRTNEVISVARSEIQQIFNGIRLVNRSNPTKKAINQLEIQYHNCMLNVDRLLEDENSRYSRKDCKISRKLDKLISEDLAQKRDVFEFDSAQKTLGREFAYLKSVIIRVKDEADKHFHEDVEDSMRNLQTENDDLRSNYAKLQHEHNNLLYEYEGMKKRFEAFDDDHEKLMALIAGRPLSVNLPQSVEHVDSIKTTEDPIICASLTPVCISSVSIGESSIKADRYVLRNTHEAESFLLKKNIQSDL